MIGKWMTKEEACAEFDITERTLYRWRTKHTIRAGHLTRRHPLTFHRDDLIEAEATERANNPSTPRNDVTPTCYAGASAINDNGVTHP